MRASIVIPAHNEEHALPATLQAILSQDYHNYEIIIVDNGSTDKTAEIARAHAARHPHIRYVYEPSLGLLRAREAGRVHATGDIIVNMDADCMPEKDWISRGVAHFKNNPEIIAVSGPYDYFDGSRSFRTISFIFQKSIYTIMHRMLQRLKKGAVVIGGNNFIKAQALRQIGGYDTSIIFYGEDTDTAKRLSKVGKMLFSRHLVMKTSARRFIREGTTRTTLLYIINFFWVTFFRVPYRKFKVNSKNILFNKLK